MLLWWGVWFVGGLAGAGTIAGFMGRRGWLCELTSHFRLQYVLILLTCAFLMLIAGKVSQAAVAADRKSVV